MALNGGPLKTHLLKHVKAFSTMNFQKACNSSLTPLCQKSQLLRFARICKLEKDLMRPLPSCLVDYIEGVILKKIEENQITN